MDDRKLNPLRLLIAVGILGYFGWLFVQPSPQTEAQKAPPAPASRPTSQSQPEPSACSARVEQVGISTYEVRLRISGSANTILVYTDQGTVTASTTEAGSAGEYRVRTPGPATAVQLDGCPPLDLR
ncbi:hypothetical protein Mlute_00315 [Meiothermus luteus]|jgi:hypothetical protein|uniref:Uncharacterized protein n=1 Tax=Meiothermus luteus TaxID=2026184 RepID=A0A399F2L5_9DEIN|nr:hypothetical protein [Meiothermus luteus]RIH89519.1 hypothetical protein Mlute_00315 [Meiothermus luteus]RMH55115.1 MAG: hypothetical protein D6684_08180 [Deinococcota bacterium]